MLHYFSKGTGKRLASWTPNPTLLALSATLRAPVFPAVVVVSTPYGLGVIACTCCIMRALGTTSLVSPCHCQRTMPC